MRKTSRYKDSNGYRRGKKINDINAVTGMLTPEVLEGLVKKIIQSKFEELVKTHPNANAFLDSLAEKVLTQS